MFPNISEQESEELKSYCKKHSFLHLDVFRCYEIYSELQGTSSNESKLKNFKRLCEALVALSITELPLNKKECQSWLDALTEHHKNIEETANLENKPVYQSIKSESYAAILEYSYIVIKSLIMVHGGALVTLLTFVATIWSSKPLVQSEIFDSLYYFVVGILITIASAGVSYLAQTCYTVFMLDEERSNFLVAGRYMQTVAFILVVLSFGLFWFGAHRVITITKETVKLSF